MNRPLTGSRVLARNTLLNLLGSGLPMLAALVSIPVLISRMGESRFGILTIAWVLVGYFSLFDFGLGRALTKLVAETLGAGKEEELPGLVWTALLMVFLLGSVGGVVLGLAASPLVRGILKIPAELQGEALTSFYLLAFALPWVVTTTGLQGVLEACQRFEVVNGLRLPMGLFYYLGPLAVLPFSSSLVPVVALLVGGRILAWGGFLWGCLRVLPVLRRKARIEWGRMRPLARFGGWMTVSNVVSPMMTHLDRFLIGALLSIAAVAYYVTPYELITKLLLVPHALMAVLFPAFAAAFTQDRERAALLFDRGVRVIFLAVFPVALVVMTFADEGMTLWLGSAFADQSAPVLRWLALGVFINCLAQVPFAFIQGIGRPDISGRLHLVEFPLYVIAIWIFSRYFGLQGVAMAWVFRVMIDTVVLFVIAVRFLPRGSMLLRNTAQITLGGIVALTLATMQHELTMKIIFLFGALLLFGMLGWWRILAPSERALIQRRASV